MEVEIGDCMLPKDDPNAANHTAVNIEGPCIRGIRLVEDATGELGGMPPENCGECFFFQKRKHLAAKLAEDTHEHQ